MSVEVMPRMPADDAELTGKSLFDEAGEVESADYDRYRSVCTPAVVGLILACLSPLAFLDWGLLAIPLLGLVLGLRGWMRIRAAPDELTGLLPARLAVVLSFVCFAGGLSFLLYVYTTEVPEGYRRIDYGYLRPPRERPNAVPTEKALQLDGEKVFIKGYIYPQAKSKFNRFLLCRDNGQCCFGGTPPLSDVILVTMAGDTRMEHTNFMVKLAGTLRVAPALAGEAGGSDGAVQGVVYQLEGAFQR